MLEDKQFIKLTFKSFALEYHSSCAYDELTVMEGNPMLGSTMLGRFCGDNVIPPPLSSSGPYMVVTFRSDSAMVYKGFNATFEFTNALGEHIS